MHLPPIRFKDFVFPHNPETLEIISTRNFRELRLPFLGVEYQDMGSMGRIVRGEGAFVGGDAYETYTKLETLYCDGGFGRLSLPHTTPFDAYFFSLTLKGGACPGWVGYSFEFRERVAAAG